MDVRIRPSARGLLRVLGVCVVIACVTPVVQSAAQSTEGTYTFRLVAGKAERSAGSTDGAAAAARFLAPETVVRGGDGTIYIREPSFQRTRRLGADGQVSTVSTTLNGPMAVAPDGTLFLVTASQIYRQLVGGTLEPYAGGTAFTALRGVAVDATGNVFVTEGFQGW